jgi:hypothetical protein
MIVEISIKEIRESQVNGVGSTAVDIVSGTFPSKLGASMLRALADEWDPKKPVMRGFGD